MIPISDVKRIAESPPAYRIMKPLWDVFSEYISMVMLMVAVFGGTLQISQDKMTCLPCVSMTVNSCYISLETWTINSEDSNSNSTSTSVPTGIIYNMDRQQYGLVDALCYEIHMHWFSKYFPYLVLLHTVIFQVCSNFWFKLPSTSSKLEHFLSILLKCFDSPWTTQALCQAVEEKTPNPKLREDVEANFEESQRSTLHVDQGIVDKQKIGDLDKKEGEQAKALFEKVKNFKKHVEDGDIVYSLYMRQIIIKVILFIGILCYHIYYVRRIIFDVQCRVETETFTGYRLYHCIYPLARLFRILASFYITLVGLYGLVTLYTLWWMLWCSLKEYSFDSIRKEIKYSDIPDVKNDLAFMLHLIDQYDPLYSKRFAVFLSEVSENKLHQLNLNYEWTLDKLRQHITKNTQDKLELNLCMLSGIPDNVFDLVELEVLKLDKFESIIIPVNIAQLKNLKELWLDCKAVSIDVLALTFLRDNLKTLHIKFMDFKDIPLWIYNLKSLEELHLISILNEENKKHHDIDPLRELKRLKVLRLKSSLKKIPQGVADVGATLQKLSIHNKGTKLMIVNNLKKMVQLKELELVRCNLERIPHIIFSLVTLQEIDLKDNNLTSIEEIMSLQHLHRLTSLKLWFNQIYYIPVQIGNLETIERLYLNNNKIDNIPVQLCYCRRLRYLDLSHNNLSYIPPEIGKLQNLQYFAVTANQIETLPPELFQCINLQTLNLGSNQLDSLPSRVGELTKLTQLELRDNQLERLPVELGMCPLLKRSGLLVEEELFNALPLEIKDKLEG
ncbi:volume-regulated anion channel subunit LRRC8A-like [Pelobates fuscus]|uniref:volume-regulated anion channel subunit LRRC8A-like n=1 Tax=Pelobates fuscus TaxID=191477 RepID=UPI002FE49163